MQPILLVIKLFKSFYNWVIPTTASQIRNLIKSALFKQNPLVKTQSMEKEEAKGDLKFLTKLIVHLSNSPFVLVMGLVSIVRED